MTKPTVSILCLVYNHEAFLRQTLDGFVMQKTSFPFEAVVHDDVSTDSSKAIIQEYAEKYPDIIKPIYEEKNLFSQGCSILMGTMYKAMRGKYVAFCEGDDYWTDPEKLQKQVDFLESHPEFSMCFHKVEEKIEGNARLTPMDRNIEQREYKLHEILFQWVVPSCSIVFRGELARKVPTHMKFTVGDNVLITTCALHGKLWCMDDCMAVYRRHAGGWTQQKRHKESAIRHAKALLESFPQQEAQKVLKIKLALEYHHLKDYCKRSKDKKEFFKLVYMICRDVPLSYLYVHREKTDNKVIKAILTFILKSARYKPDIKVPRN